MTPTLYEWQKIDKENGLVMPWFVHKSLDWIKKEDWRNKVVFSYGCGSGDAWIARRCKNLYVVERDENWLIKAADICFKNNINNVQYFYRPCNEGDADKYDYYTNIPNGIFPNVIIVDDIMRYECIIMAIANVSRPFTLIVDNWNQDFVFI